MSKNFEIVADRCIAHKHMAIIGACHIYLTAPVIAVKIQILRKKIAWNVQRRNNVAIIQHFYTLIPKKSLTRQT